VNLRKRFDIEDRPIDDDTRIIVLNFAGKTVGVVVDSVSRVIKLTHEEIQAPPVTISSVERSSIQGVARVGERLVVILEVDRLLPMDGMKTATDLVTRAS
jgi:purine-binding chemotaxis protein CheW